MLTFNHHDDGNGGGGYPGLCPIEQLSLREQRAVLRKGGASGSVPFVFLILIFSPFVSSECESPLKMSALPLNLQNPELSKLFCTQVPQGWVTAPGEWTQTDTVLRCISGLRQGAEAPCEGGLGQLPSPAEMKEWGWGEERREERGEKRGRREGGMRRNRRKGEGRKIERDEKE